MPNNFLVPETRVEEDGTGDLPADGKDKMIRNVPESEIPI